jgi:hypothetical protein
MPLSKSTASWLRNQRLPTILLGVLLAATGLLMWWSQRYFSPVTDELANIPGGLNYLATGRYTDATQPPLLRYLMALPQWFLGVDPLASDESGQYFWVDYGRRYVFQNKVSWEAIVGVSRAVVIVLTLVQIWLVYHWSRQLWGAWAALIAATFLAFEPNTIAHGQLATLDLGLSLAFVWAVYALWRYLQAPTWARFWWLQVSTVVAFMVKFSALTLLISGAICLFLYRKRQPLHWKRFLWTPLIFFGLFWATYLFQMKSAGEDPQVNRPNLNIPVKDRIHEYATQVGMTGQQVLDLRVPMYDFWKGFGLQVFHAMFQDKWRTKYTYQYLNGEYADRGWRTYFAWSFVFKSTLATLLMLLLLVGCRIRDALTGRITRDATALVLLVAPIMLFFVCSWGTINIGHRYILPVYPFLAMSAGYLAVRFGRRMTVVVLSLLVLHMASSASVWPHHLSYFNELSRSGHHLSDSNVDWGQDLLFVKEDIQRPEVQATTTWGDLSGVVRPLDLAFQLQKIPSTADSLGAGNHMIYLSINRNLNRSQAYPNGIYPWLQARKPNRKVGTSVFVYELTK